MTMTRDEIVIYARVLMLHHKLDAWSFRFDSHKTRFGVCNYRECYIGLSWPVCKLNSQSDICDTIKHEISHALAKGAGHGRIFKLTCMIVGARPQTCAAFHVKSVPGRYRFECPCGVTGNRYRRPVIKPGRRDVCRRCRRPVIFVDTRASVASVASVTPSPGELYAALTGN